MIMLWVWISLTLLMTLFLILSPLLKGNKKSVIFLFTLISFFSILCYFHFGQSKRYIDYIKNQRAEKAAQAKFATIKNPQVIINQLILHLKQNPVSARGWYLLGKLYFSENDFNNALISFTRAFKIKPENLDYSLNYLQCSMIIHRGLNQQDGKLLQFIANQNPSNPQALNLLAMNYYVTKNYTRAAKTWEKLLPLFPAGSDMQHQILVMIAKAD